MAAEQALVLPAWEFDKRRLIACGMIAVIALGIMTSCEGKSTGGGSPIDTDGTPGGGYNPPRRIHLPKDLRDMSLGIYTPAPGVETAPNPVTEVTIFTDETFAAYQDIVATPDTVLAA